MGKRVAIIQSNYIPWKGYFNIIQWVDEFVLLDDVQYTRRDWRNRNFIKTPAGLRWLTIPVNVKGKFSILINEVECDGSAWREEHWNKIREAYKNTRYFSVFSEYFESLYIEDSETNLSRINFKFIKLIKSLLKIDTPIRNSSEFESPQEKTERLVHICKALKAEEYVSGQSAKSYLRVDLFEENGIRVKWADYSDYPVYNQLHPPFNHNVSVIDLIFNEGPESGNFLKQKL
jgi:hypothetical protein